MGIQKSKGSFDLTQVMQTALKQMVDGNIYT
jgi:hypothetical protein